ncbi:MAG: M28 family peptidase [Chloroflexi bacterium]|nr:M28 family peptidase [Chloroflexota bacterium]
MRQSIVARAWLVLILLFAPLPLSVAGQTAEPIVLVRVALAGPMARLDLFVYAQLQDASGQDYALVIAPRSQLDQAGVPYRVLDAGGRGSDYVLALKRGAAARAGAIPPGLTVLHDDGRRIIVRAAGAQAEALTELGFDLQRLPDTPLTWSAAPVPFVAPAAITSDPQVVEMIGRVQQSTVYSDTAGLSGEQSVTIGGSPYTIATRYTASGTPITQATQYVYEHLQALGLGVSYQNWSDAYSGYSGRNVIAAQAGLTHPAEIVLVTAHLDDTSSRQQRMTNAPGADDNASGAVGVLVAADLLSHYRFERTVRYVLFTGEEQGLLGSNAYAAAVKAAGENVVAVYNMDMIAWDAADGPTLRLHTRLTSNPGYPGDLALANLFGDVLTTYGLSANLTPIITADGESASDHASFWNRGYPAILAIEDDYDDFNSYYHSTNDKLSRLNMTYFTNYVKASVGLAAHLGRPLLAVAIRRSAGGAALTWSYCCSSVGRYEVYRATAPYLAPAAPGSAKLGDVTPAAVWSTMAFTDTHAFDPPGASYFYRIAAIVAGEQPYTRTLEVGAFSFALSSGETD